MLLQSQVWLSNRLWFSCTIATIKNILKPKWIHFFFEKISRIFEFYKFINFIIIKNLLIKLKEFKKFWYLKLLYQKCSLNHSKSVHVLSQGLTTCVIKMLFISGWSNNLSHDSGLSFRRNWSITISYIYIW